MLSGLLHGGAGTGPVQAAVATWLQLSGAYAVAAAELELALVNNQAQWQGVGAQAYALACNYYLVWLREISAHCAGIAADYQAIAVGFDAAIAQMPTPLELSANRIQQILLLSSNFFGVNAIPIGVNEAEYFQMRLRAATAMGLYEWVAESATAAALSRPRPVLLMPDLNDEAKPFPGMSLTTMLRNTAWILAFPVRLPLMMLLPQSWYWATDSNAAVLTILLGYLAVGTAVAEAVATPPAGQAAGITLPVNLPLSIEPHTSDLRKENGTVLVTERYAADPRRETAVTRLTAASKQNTGTMGCAGTAYKDTVTQPRGLTSFTNSELSIDISGPIIPATWTPPWVKITCEL